MVDGRKDCSTTRSTLDCFGTYPKYLPLSPDPDLRFTSGNPSADLPAPATTFGGIESAQAAAQAAVAALVVNLPRPTTTLRLNNMLTASDLEDESSFGDIEEETKVGPFFLWSCTCIAATRLVLHLVRSIICLISWLCFHQLQR